MEITASLQKIKLDQFYTTVFAQVFSPNGKYLVASTNHGTIALFNMAEIVNTNSDEPTTNQDWKYPVFLFKAAEGTIYSLLSTDTFLICGCVEYVIGYRWTDLYSHKATAAWSWQIKSDESFEKPETNGLANKNGTIFAGCGDNYIHSWDMETGKYLAKYKEHTDYIHCLTSFGNEIVSGGEDGKVIFWDPRGKQPVTHTIEPHLNEKCARPNFGKWVSCVAVDLNEDWLLCGGGPTLSMWHLKSYSPVTNFPTPKSTPTWATFHDDMVISCGTEPTLFQWGFDAQLKAQVPTSAPFLYSAAILEQSQLLSVGGESRKIDVCRNFTYKDFTLFCVDKP